MSGNEAYIVKFLRLGEHSLVSLLFLYIVVCIVKSTDAWLAGLFAILAVLVLLFILTGEALLIGGIIAVSIAIGAVITVRIVTRR
jgi:hypothetical protein